MKIAAIRKLSLIDYPWKISSVIFTQGCNFRCGYCHNPHLVIPSLYSPEISEEEALSFLSSRVGKIEGVVISGGEPAMHAGLDEFIKKIRAMNFLVKLDTNGSLPEVVQSLIDDSLLDYIAMDIKAPFDQYPELCGPAADITKIKETISLIKSSGLPHQFRATVVKGIHSIDDIRAMEEIAGEPLKLQNFKFTKDHISTEFTRENEFSTEEFEALSKKIEV
ncbi:MAG TPA: anaerobic ribonucleoside-triphosphate reductase activating protein [Ignavibacteriales bacterium]|nr:anaerobic ribonucleoside-triphosphate reductase activating protein [Ignavibacteriales bacterium]